MARTWMIDGKRGDPEYDVGLAEFYAFVRENVTNTSSMACPCDMCLNMRYMRLSDVQIHLQKRNFNPKYRRWTFHGESRIIKGGMGKDINIQFSEIEKETCFNLIEKDSDALEDLDLGMNSESVDESEDNSENIWGDFCGDNEEEENSSINVDEDIIDDDEDLDENDLDNISVVLEKLKDTEMPLYKSCKKYTKLSSIVKLYNLKAKNGWSDKSFNDLLELVKDMLPEDNVLPNRTYEAKKILRGIGMKYEKIHACPNDCILYRKEYETCTHCPVCKEWRYKSSYGFLCPASLSEMVSFENEDNRSDYIVKAMTCTGCERGRKLVFAPYYEGKHWMLAAINQKESVIYWCDPAGGLEPRKFLKDTINMTFAKINSMDPLLESQQKQLEWKTIKCPTQPFRSVLCGYYVCRYMLEIIKGRYINIIPSFMIKAPKTYSVEQIDEVREIWAEYALKFKAQVFDDNV